MLFCLTRIFFPLPRLSFAWLVLGLIFSGFPLIPVVCWCNYWMLRAGIHGNSWISMPYKLLTVWVQLLIFPIILKLSFSIGATKSTPWLSYAPLAWFHRTRCFSISLTELSFPIPSTVLQPCVYGSVFLVLWQFFENWGNVFTYVSKFESLGPSTSTVLSLRKAFNKYLLK